MQDYQKRVIEEKADLDDRLLKLRKFISVGNATYDALPHPEKARLVRQVLAMGDYSQVLKERIDAFEVSHA
jgi:hypothetical protein